MIHFHRLFLFLSTVKLAFAFSSGAGQCLVGEASVGGSHQSADATTTTGSLDDGGFQMILQSTQMADGGLATLGPAGFDYSLVVTGSRSFRGISVVVTDVFNTNVPFLLEATDDESALQEAFNCPEQFALTHMDASLKDSVSMTLNVEEAFVGDVDVTIVVQNSNGVSEYYHSSFRIQMLEELVSDFLDDCYEQLVVADADQNFVLDESEYLDLIAALGQDKCYTPEQELTEEQQDTFETVACTICLRDGEEWTCCVNPSGLAIASADQPDMATPLQKRHMSSICQFTYADIPPSCNTGNVSDVPSDMPSSMPISGPEKVDLELSIATLDP